MDEEFSHRAKKCCSLENKRLMKDLQRCDSQFPSRTLRHLCFRVAAQRSGRRSKKCIVDGCPW